MLGFKSPASAGIVLPGVETRMVHMTRKRQAKYAGNPSPSLAEPFSRPDPATQQSSCIQIQPCPKPIREFPA